VSGLRDLGVGTVDDMLPISMSRPRVQEWSGVTLSGDERFDGLHLWATLGSISSCPPRYWRSAAGMRTEPSSWTWFSNTASTARSVIPVADSVCGKTVQPPSR
jgi:hypothetical protein